MTVLKIVVNFKADKFSLHKIDVIPKSLSTKTRFREREGTVVSTH